MYTISMRLLGMLAAVCLVAAANANSQKIATAATEATTAASVAHASTVSTLTTTTNDTSPQIKITKLQLNEHALDALLQLDDEISKTAAKSSDDAGNVQQRAARNIKDEKLKKAAAALTDAEINEIMQMIKFPEDRKHEVLADDEAHKLNADPNEIEPRHAMPDGKARQGRGYYILAFSPDSDENDEQFRYNKIDIIPEERFAMPRSSRKQAKQVKRADVVAEEEEELDEDEDDALVNNDEDDDYDNDDDDDDYTDDDDDDNSDSSKPNSDALDNEVEARFMSMRQLNRYIRRLMRQIRKGTRKIQHITRVKKKVKTFDTEPTVENFVKGLYRTQQKRKQKKTNWFSWY